MEMAMSQQKRRLEDYQEILNSTKVQLKLCAFDPTSWLRQHQHQLPISILVSMKIQGIDTSLEGEVRRIISLSKWIVDIVRKYLNWEYSSICKWDTSYVEPRLGNHPDDPPTKPKPTRQLEINRLVR